MTADVPEKVLQSLDETRRSFLSKLIVGSAFAAPSVVSFSMSGLAVGAPFFSCSNTTDLCSNMTRSDCGLIADRVTFKNFGNCDYAGRNFHGFTLVNNCFEDTIFAGANLSHTNLSCSIFKDADLAGANLSGANLTAADLDGADVAGANLNGANLSEASLRHANLAGVNLNGANLTGANLEGANLIGANLHGITWSDTTCPDGTNSDNHGGTCVLNL